MTDEDDFDRGNRRPIDSYFQDLATAVIEEPVWIVRNLIPKGLTIVGGPPKSGKSTITAAVAALVSGHTCKALPAFISQVPRTGPIIWLSAEANAGELKHMLVHGMNVTDLQPDESMMVAEDPWMFRLDDAEGLRNLIEWLEDREPIACIIDPFAEFHDKDEKVAGDMVRLLRPLRAWAVDNDRAVILVHHTSKKPADQKETSYDAFDMRGSSALFGKADGVIMVTPRGKEEDRRAEVKAIFKRAKGWQKELNFAIFNHVSREAGLHVNDLTKKVFTLVGIGAQTVEDIRVQLSQAAPSAVKESLQTLEDNGLIKRIGEGKWTPVTKK